MGIPRIQETLGLIDEKKSRLKQIYEKEHVGWDLFYDVLDEIEKGLKEDDEFALVLQKKARDMVRQCLIEGLPEGRGERSDYPAG